MIDAQRIRHIILEQSKRANVGHIGSALSIADLVAALYSGVMNVENPEDPERDRLVLSKGHAVLALYAALHLKGWVTTEQINTYCADDSLLGVHPEHALRGIDFCSGSLGQGLSIGVGAALAARLQNSSRRVFVIISDAECNEGAVWEAIMFAGHHQLSNLTVLVDLNGQQALGYTKEVLELSSLAAKFTAFGWNALEVDGHDGAALRASICDTKLEIPAPRVIIARTTFGKGVSYMENQIKWHYWPMSDEEYAVALKEVEAGV